MPPAALGALRHYFLRCARQRDWEKALNAYAGCLISGQRMRDLPNGALIAALYLSAHHPQEGVGIHTADAAANANDAASPTTQVARVAHHERALRLAQLLHESRVDLSPASSAMLLQCAVAPLMGRPADPNRGHPFLPAGAWQSACWLLRQNYTVSEKKSVAFSRHADSSDRSGPSPARGAARLPGLERVLRDLPRSLRGYAVEDGPSTTRAWASRGKSDLKPPNGVEGRSADADATLQAVVDMCQRELHLHWGPDGTDSLDALSLASRRLGHAAAEAASAEAPWVGAVMEQLFDYSAPELTATPSSDGSLVGGEAASEDDGGSSQGALTPRVWPAIPSLSSTSVITSPPSARGAQPMTAPRSSSMALLEQGWADLGNQLIKVHGTRWASAPTSLSPRGSPSHHPTGGTPPPIVTIEDRGAASDDDAGVLRVLRDDIARLLDAAPSWRATLEAIGNADQSHIVFRGDGIVAKPILTALLGQPSMSHAAATFTRDVLAAQTARFGVAEFPPLWLTDDAELLSATALSFVDGDEQKRGGGAGSDGEDVPFAAAMMASWLERRRPPACLTDSHTGDDRNTTIAETPRCLLRGVSEIAFRVARRCEKASLRDDPVALVRVTTDVGSVAMLAILTLDYLDLFRGEDGHRFSSATIAVETGLLRDLLQCFTLLGDVGESCGTGRRGVQSGPSTAFSGEQPQWWVTIARRRRFSELSKDQPMFKLISPNTSDEAEAISPPFSPPPARLWTWLYLALLERQSAVDPSAIGGGTATAASSSSSGMPATVDAAAATTRSRWLDDMSFLLDGCDDSHMEDTTTAAAQQIFRMEQASNSRRRDHRVHLILECMELGYFSAATRLMMTTSPAASHSLASYRDQLAGARRPIPDGETEGEVPPLSDDAVAATDWHATVAVDVWRWLLERRYCSPPLSEGAATRLVESQHTESSGCASDGAMRLPPPSFASSGTNSPSTAFDQLSAALRHLLATAGGSVVVANSAAPSSSGEIGSGVISAQRVAKWLLVDSCLPTMDVAVPMVSLLISRMCANATTPTSSHDRLHDEGDLSSLQTFLLPLCSTPAAQDVIRKSIATALATTLRSASRTGRQMVLPEATTPNAPYPSSRENLPVMKEEFSLYVMRAQSEWNSAPSGATSSKDPSRTAASWQLAIAALQGVERGILTGSSPSDTAVRELATLIDVLPSLEGSVGLARVLVQQHASSSSSSAQWSKRLLRKATTFASEELAELAVRLLPSNFFSDREGGGFQRLTGRLLRVATAVQRREDRTHQSARSSADALAASPTRPHRGATDIARDILRRAARTSLGLAAFIAAANDDLSEVLRINAEDSRPSIAFLADVVAAFRAFRVTSVTGTDGALHHYAEAADVLPLRPDIALELLRIFDRAGLDGLSAEVLSCSVNPMLRTLDGTTTTPAGGRQHAATEAVMVTGSPSPDESIVVGPQPTRLTIRVTRQHVRLLDGIWLPTSLLAFLDRAFDLKARSLLEQGYRFLFQEVDRKETPRKIDHQHAPTTHAALCDQQGGHDDLLIDKLLGIDDQPSSQEPSKGAVRLPSPAWRKASSAVLCRPVSSFPLLVLGDARTVATFILKASAQIFQSCTIHAAMFFPKDMATDGHGAEQLRRHAWAVAALSEAFLATLGPSSGTAALMGATASQLCRRAFHQRQVHSSIPSPSGKAADVAPPFLIDAAAHLPCNAIATVLVVGRWDTLWRSHDPAAETEGRSAVGAADLLLAAVGGVRPEPNSFPWPHHWLETIRSMLSYWVNVVSNLPRPNRYFSRGRLGGGSGDSDLGCATAFHISRHAPLTRASVLFTYDTLGLRDVDELVTLFSDVLDRDTSPEDDRRRACCQRDIASNVATLWLLVAPTAHCSVVQTQRNPAAEKRVDGGYETGDTLTAALETLLSDPSRDHVHRRLARIIARALSTECYAAEEQTDATTRSAPYEGVELGVGDFDHLVSVLCPCVIAASQTKGGTYPPAESVSPRRVASSSATAAIRAAWSLQGNGRHITLGDARGEPAMNSDAAETAVADLWEAFFTAAAAATMFSDGDDGGCWGSIFNGKLDSALSPLTATGASGASQRLGGSTSGERPPTCPKAPSISSCYLLYEKCIPARPMLSRETLREVARELGHRWRPGELVGLATSPRRWSGARHGGVDQKPMGAPSIFDVSLENRCVSLGGQSWHAVKGDVVGETEGQQRQNPDDRVRGEAELRNAVVDSQFVLHHRYLSRAMSWMRRDLRHVSPPQASSASHDVVSICVACLTFDAQVATELLVCPQPLSRAALASLSPLWPAVVGFLNDWLAPHGLAGAELRLRVLSTGILAAQAPLHPSRWDHGPRRTPIGSTGASDVRIFDLWSEVARRTLWHSNFDDSPSSSAAARFILPAFERWDAIATFMTSSLEALTCIAAGRTDTKQSDEAGRLDESDGEFQADGSTLRASPAAPPM